MKKFAVALLLIAGTATAADQREALLLDFGWKFHFGDAASPADDFGFGSDHAAYAKAGVAPAPAQLKFDDSGWRTLNLPHDWAVELDFVNGDKFPLRSHGYKPIGRQFPKTSIGWYRRTFVVSSEDRGRRLAIKFDGVFRDSIAWLNGHFLGRNASGYSEFTFDVTDYVLFGEKNVLTVRVDATQYEGWFYEGAGIYRHVWLLKCPPLHIPPYGVFVRSEGGKVTITTQIVNDSESPVTATLVSSVIGDNSVSDSVALSPHQEKTVTQSMEISNPQLWSLESPHLYTLVSSIGTDRVESRFGIRTISFDKEKGFFLNGKRVEIKGTCNHQDHAGTGIALPDALQEFRIRRLKEMGANAYRTSHNPPTPELLDICDRSGMLVLDENRLMGSTPELLENLRRLILRDRNHPSVILWSLGNEEWSMQNTDVGAAIARTMKRLQKELDPTRLSTYAADNGDRYEGINSVVDVRGVNYIGRGDIDKYHREHPDQPMVGTEEASAYCTRGVYANDAGRGFMSDYDVNAPDYGATAERWWKFYAERPYLAGAFVWTGFDYRGEPSPYQWPNISSQFGIVDTCGFPKNTFFYYQAWWSDADVLHISPHWNWSDKEGQPIDVWVNSNADSVELFLNGRSLGSKKMERNSHLQWSVPYAAGKLEAKARRSGRLLLAKIETTGAPASIRAVADRVAINADGEDVSVVSITAVDAKNREVPNADNLVHFTIEGSGAMIGVGNGSPASHEPDKFLQGGWQRRLFGGKCQVLVQASRNAGPIVLRASSDGLKDAVLTINAVPAQPRAFVP
ncbi:MAG TPA: beta-galactosidase GalA [Thermoanaerobaculia bacterium]|nr:beta-galactosidase GalA [Thermoanaerobaculia bacterium]